MNAAEHYTTAQHCLATADQQGPTVEDAALWLDLGIGHALLAIAALLAEQSTNPAWADLLNATNQGDSA